MIEGVLDQANVNLSIGGIGLEFGYNTITQLIDDGNVIDSILLGIKVTSYIVSSIKYRLYCLLHLIASDSYHITDCKFSLV